MYEEWIFRYVNQVDVVKNIRGIKSYSDMFYSVKDLTEKKLL